MSVLLNSEVLAFLDMVMPVVVGTRRRDGSVKLTPAWYEYHAGRFRLASFHGAHWVAQLRRDRAAALLFVDPHDMYRAVHAEATPIEITTDGARAQMDRLSHRYTGGPYQFPMTRELVRLELEPSHLRSSFEPSQPTIS